jgi:hypothetical protein
MEKSKLSSTDIPSALPGVEDDDAREKLLLEDPSIDPEETVEEECVDNEPTVETPRKRRRQVVKTFAAFAVFICLLIVGVAWFFGMGWFSKTQTQAVNRTGKHETQTPPVTDDEKLKMALSLIASGPTSSANDAQPNVSGSAENYNTGTPSVPDLKSDTGSGLQTVRSDRDSYTLPQPVEIRSSNSASSEPLRVVTPQSETRTLSRAASADDARGRSLFFGRLKKQSKEDEISNTANSPNFAAETEVPKTKSSESLRPAQIPFGTLLPVRLVASIYTLRNSGGFVRMELTRPVEGKGYSYPAGTMIVGNVRSGESARAFVTVVGLIDPASGELVKFSGELLGRDGASGIEGKRRNLTSQWARVFRGMKDTAFSLLGAIGTSRSGSTVILSEPMRRGTESMSENLSGALLKSDRKDTFLEVAAGSNGYVLVTGLPENSAVVITNPTQEGVKE